jgi:peptide/nickel transport system ATP-binding protein
MTLLQVTGLSKHYRIGLMRRRTVKAVDRVDLVVEEGMTLGLMGESGSGKSTLARCIMRLIEPTSGRVAFEGEDITALRGRELRHLATGMQMIFQDPAASFDPRMRISDSILEPMRLHRLCTRQEEGRELERLIDLTNLAPELMDRYPHQLSGGQLQRAMISRILGLRPRLVIADEPTSMLDVLVQAQVLDLLKRLQREEGLAMLFISHDREVVEWMSDSVMVMQGGMIKD